MKSLSFSFLVACHKEAGADIRVSAKEAQKLLDGFNAV